MTELKRRAKEAAKKQYPAEKPLFTSEGLAQNRARAIFINAYVIGAKAVLDDAVKLILEKFGLNETDENSD